MVHYLLPYDNIARMTKPCEISRYIRKRLLESYQVCAVHALGIRSFDARNV